MTILRRNVQELLNHANRGVSVRLSPQDADLLTKSINDEIKARHGGAVGGAVGGASGGVTREEVARTFEFHIQRVTRVTAEMSARDIAIARTRDEIISNDAARRATVVRDSGLSYISSIETTRSLNANVGKGVIRPKKKNIAGVAGGVRLF